MCFKYDTRLLAACLRNRKFDCWAAEQAFGLFGRNTAASVCRKPCWVSNFGKRLSEATRSAAMRRVCDASLISASGIWREGCDATHGSVRTCRQHGLLHMCTWRRAGDASWRVSAAALRRARDAHAPRAPEAGKSERATRSGRALLGDKSARFRTLSLLVLQHLLSARPAVFCKSSPAFASHG